jgi:hypothetical protein
MVVPLVRLAKVPLIGVLAVLLIAPAFLEEKSDSVGILALGAFR